MAVKYSTKGLHRRTNTTGLRPLNQRETTARAAARELRTEVRAHTEDLRYAAVDAERQYAWEWSTLLAYVIKANRKIAWDKVIAEYQTNVGEY